MTLANPAGLYFALAAVPILLLHLLRPRRAEAVVSSAMLWRDDTEGATAASPWQRIPPTLLLLLQLLLVALLTVLLADPTTRSPSPLTEHTVVVLDTSASMASVDGSPDRLSDARAEALDLVDEIPRGGRLSLVIASTTPRVAVSATTDLDGYESAVRAARQSDGPADLLAAMTLADGLETPDARLGIVLISDGAHTDVELAGLPNGVTHRLVGAGDVNHAITSLSVTRTSTGLSATAVTEVTGGGSVLAPLRFDVDDLTRAVIDVEIEAGGPTVTTVDLPEGERVVARLGGDDLLAIDNTAYAVTRSRADLTVSVHGESGPFLDTLLRALPGVTIVDPDVDNPEISIFVEAEVPADITRPFLAIAPPEGVPGVTVEGSVESPVPALVRSQDPLLAGLDLTRLRIVESQRVSAPTGEVLLGAEGAPLLVRGQRAGVPFLYLSFPIGRSTLPVDLVFPVLGQRMIEELGGSVVVAPALEVGDPIVPPAGRDAVVVAPNGTERLRPAGAGAITADRPGFWTVRPSGGAERTIAVTVGPAESRIDPLPVAPTDPRPLRPGEEPDSTERSWRWALALVVVVVGGVEWYESRRRRGVPGWQWRLATVLRAVAVAALVAGILGPAVSLRADEVATVFVLDRSDSVGRLGASRGLDAAVAAAAGAPDDARMGVVVAADGARIEQLLGDADRVTGLAQAAIDGDRTDLAAGLRLAAALLPEDAKRRIVVVSDGRSTGGDVDAEAAILGERGIPIDYVLLEPTAGADAAVVAIDAPTAVEEGARIPIEVVVQSTASQPASITLRRDGVPVASIDVVLEAGSSSFRFDDEPGTTGLVSYSATVDALDDARVQNDTARTTVDIEGPAEVLVVEGSPAAGDVLAQALESSGLVVEVIDPFELPALDRLVGYDATVLVDVALDQLSADQVGAVAAATRELGRGLVTVGGPQSYGMGGYRDSELEQVLPVVSDVLDPRRLRQVAQVMALDTSESMGECHCAEGFQGQDRDLGGVGKTDIARAGAARAIATLNANDEIGVLAVDTEERWLIDLQQLPTDDVIDAGLAQVRPSGNTDLSGTLPAAADALRASNAGLKHIILFTDGFTSQASLAEMERQAGELRDEGITVSVVATGEGAARQLNAVAASGGGRFYPGRDLTRIPEILVEESVLASRQFINEGEYLPVVTDTSPLVDSLTAAPPLLGFVATTSKPTARTSLRIGPEEDPLLASWQVGLGRATSWTSDANPRWSQFWVGWDGYVDFWGDLVRDTFPVRTTGAVRTVVDGDTLRIRAEAPEGTARVEAVVTEPGGGRVDVRMREVSPGIFESAVAADAAGIYAVGIQAVGGEESSTLGTSIASVSYAAEYRPGPADEPSLARLSELSGGRGAIEATAAFDADELVSGRRSVELGGWLILAAALAWLAAAVLSRLWLGRRAVVPAAPPRHTDRPSPYDDRGGGDEAIDDVPEREPEPEPAPASAATVSELLRARRERRGQ